LSHHAAALVIVPLYYCLPLVAAVVLAFSDNRKRVGAALILAPVMALPLYVAFPACGPGHIGEPGAMRNCIPSLHLAWALLLYWFSPKFLRVPTALFVLITCATTLMTGEHYAIDLVVAVPFTVAVVAASRLLRNDNYARRSKMC
jgi:PAP2 superfamily